MNKTLRKAKREWVSLLSKIRLKRVTSDYLGEKLRIPVIHGFFNGGYIVPAEFWMGDCLRAFVNTKPGVVIDIGVNVGLYLVKLRLISKDREYIGFEPNPFCVFFTQELIRLNAYQHARVFPVALSESDGVSRFYASVAGDKAGSLIGSSKDMQSQNHTIDVITMTGDRFIDTLNLDEIAAIKIDVEEAEIYVLKGLKQTIARYRPYVYCEILYFRDDPERRQRATEIYNLVRSMNYVVLGVQTETRALQAINDVSEINANYEQEFIFCPEELEAIFRENIVSGKSSQGLP